jgi:hypothetical protein
MHEEGSESEVQVNSPRGGRTVTEVGDTRGEQSEEIEVGIRQRKKDNDEEMTETINT